MEVTPTLLDLQSFDLTIDRLTARERALRTGDEVAAVRREADGAEGALGELRLAIDAMDRDATKLEHEIDSLTRKSADEEARLYGGAVANVKELEAIRHEVENLGKRRSDREDELLSLMEQREQLERRAKDAEAVATDLRTKVDAAGSSATEELERIAGELAVATTSRSSLAGSLDPELLELYDDLRRQKKGVGAAALVDGVCQGCHEKLSAVELDHVKRAGGVPRCEHCRRILVL
jgi:predicted  nucleic acid-binding Zn-ribbon protein